MSHTPLSLRSAWRFAWGALARHFGLFAGILLTMAAAWVVLEIVVVRGQQFGLGLWAVAHLAFLVFFAGLEAGLARVCLDLCDGGAPTFARALAYLALGPKFLAGQVAYLLLVGVGLALLVVPGLYLGARLGLFSLRLVDGQANLLGSFRHSAALSRGVVGQLASLGVALLVLNGLGAAVLGLGLFVTVPVSVLMLASVYRQLGTVHPSAGD
jgi:hypothetical protein